MIRRLLDRTNLGQEGRHCACGGSCYLSPVGEFSVTSRYQPNPQSVVFGGLENACGM